MKQEKTRFIRYGMLSISILFFTFWFFFDGIRVAVDTESYVTFSLSREPLYPSFLAFFRFIFGQEYFAWIGFFQSMLWAFAVWYLCDVLYQTMKLGNISYALLLILNFLICLSTRFLAGRKTLYSLDIASEGIAIPLYILFVTELFLYIYKQKKANLVKIILIGILLLSVRKQMYIVVPIMGVVFGICMLLKKIRLKKLIFLWIMAGFTLLGAVLLDIGYNYMLRGEAVRHSTDSSALLINAIFVSTEEDAMNIKDENVRKLFLDIVNTKIENGWGYESAPEGLGALSEHYSDNFDNIAFNIVNPSFYDFLEEQGVEEYVERELSFGNLNDYMFSSIVKDNAAKMIHVFVANARTGFCNSIAKDSEILVPIVFLIYVCFIIFCVYLGIKQKCTPEIMFAIVVAVCLAINVISVSIMIFSQSRYMIYNMPLFYSAFYVMFCRIREMLLVKREKEVV